MKTMRKTVKLFKALADENRVRILKMLETRGLYVCEITEVLHLALSTVSKHLSILRDAGFIVDEKDSRWVCYRLNEESDDQCVQELLHMLANRLPGQPGDQRELAHVLACRTERRCLNENLMAAVLR
jgi:ArsR family transcriptional regulator